MSCRRVSTLYSPLSGEGRGSSPSPFPFVLFFPVGNAEEKFRVCLLAPQKSKEHETGKERKENKSDRRGKELKVREQRFQTGEIFAKTAVKWRNFKSHGKILKALSKFPILAKFRKSLHFLHFYALKTNILCKNYYKIEIIFYITIWDFPIISVH